MMKYNRISYWRPVQFLLACALFASTTQNAIGGTILHDIEDFLSGSGNFPVATAYLSLYDPSGAFIDRQQMDATGLLAAGFVDTGSELLFNGSLTFSDLYPLVAGDSGGELASVHDFSISTVSGSFDTDVITMQIDWSGLNQNQSLSQTWGLVIGDDFVNGIAYYEYGLLAPPEAFSYGSASFSLEFATGVAPVPLPATAWLLGSGIIGLLGFARHKAHS